MISFLAIGFIFQMTGAQSGGPGPSEKAGDLQKPQFIINKLIFEKAGEGRLYAPFYDFEFQAAYYKRDFLDRVPTKPLKQPDLLNDDAWTLLPKQTGVLVKPFDIHGQLSVFIRTRKENAWMDEMTSERESQMMSSEQMWKIERGHIDEAGNFVKDGSLWLGPESS